MMTKSGMVPTLAAILFFAVPELADASPPPPEESASRGAIAVPARRSLPALLDGGGDAVRQVSGGERREGVREHGLDRDRASALSAAGPRRAPASATVPDTGRPFQVHVSTELRHFSWTETLRDGSEFVSESGMLFVLEAVPSLSLGRDRRVVVETGLEMSFGSVGYNGGIQRITQDGQAVNIPATGSTGYFGFEVNPRAGYAFAPSNRLRIVPLAGISLEWWRRDLTGGVQIRNADGSTATITSGGYIESYTSFFVQGGVRAGYAFSRDLHLDAMLGLKIPLSISENVDESSEGNGEHTLNPGISPRLGLELGVAFDRFHAALTFDRWTLAESPKTSVVRNGQVSAVRQPDSTRTLLGLKVGYLL